ncbi:MerR family transcriptional regulator [Nocardia sp. 2]|uniref:MerR family transcriptional regulator n=1 Tax=Nocardia acididurans TaxID=2802282 RepID=A0ABS1MGG0_9NOCA|nr:MerR family transcriptional regulator [Nocardia acididurans]MBL1079743.1 MerR family transcriptional regulator [Nocardia acididurans]
MAGESEYTIDDLARAAETTVRSIRVYHERGLLPSPEVRGRIGYYNPNHLDRLQTIGRLLGRGMRLNGIRELLDAWDRGDGLGEVLGVNGAEQVPPVPALTIEVPPVMTDRAAPPVPSAWTLAPWCVELSGRLTAAGVDPADAQRLLQQLAADCARLTEQHANTLLRGLIGLDLGRPPRSASEHVRLETDLATARLVVARAASELIERAIERYCEALSSESGVVRPPDLPLPVSPRRRDEPRSC